MKNFALLTILSGLTGIASAQGEITHSGYCSEFERRNGCTEFYSQPSYEEMCSCPGETAPPPPPLNGTHCGFPNHMTGDRYCCNYNNGVQQNCWTQ